jgi:hypothetical protein
VWKDTQDQWDWEKIVVVRGRVDAKGREPKIICESVSDQIRDTRPTGDDAAQPSPSSYHHSTTRVLSTDVSDHSTPSLPARREPAQTGDSEEKSSVPNRAPPSAPADSPTVPQDTRPQKLIITVRRSGDQETDVEQLQTLHGLLKDFEGANPFKFHLLGGNQKGDSLELDFPNDRTRFCPELERELVAMLGPGCYHWE